MNLGNGNLSGPWFNINLKMSSYQYRKSRYRDKMILQLSYVHNGISYILVYPGKMTSLYWIRPLGTGYVGLMWACFRVRYPNGFLFFYHFGICVGPNFSLGWHTPTHFQGKTPPRGSPPRFCIDSQIKVFFSKNQMLSHCYHKLYSVSLGRGIYQLIIQWLRTKLQYLHC